MEGRERGLRSPSGEVKILIVAGEASGDLHGAKVAESLLRLQPQLKIYGVGGRCMRQAGAEILLDSSELAVVGITEVLAHFGKIFKAYRFLRQFIQRSGLGLVILIDFPDFNLALAGVAKKAGIPVLYYISPQVWAWRLGRVKKIARRVAKMAVIFPFELPIYQEAGVPVEFVGHPLLDIMPSPREDEPACREFNGDPLIALLPGSRVKEIKSLLPEMMRSTEILLKKIPEAKFIIAAAPTIAADALRNIVKSFSVPVRIIEGRTYEVIQAADLAIVASGTATLETGILGKPMVIIYRVSPLSFQIGKALVKVRCIGLVNIVAGKRFIPELLQEEACGERIASEALRILEDEPYRLAMVEELKAVREKLGTPGASGRVAQMAIEMIRTAHHPGS